MTRRSLLAGSAGALAAAALARPRGALAAPAAPGEARVGELPIGRLTPAGRTIELPRVTDLLGVQWDGPADAGVQLRVAGPRGSWSPWVSAGAHGHGPDGAPAAGAPIGEPVWTGGTRTLRLRSDRPLQGVRLHLVDVSGGIGARRRAHFGTLAGLAGALPLANAGVAAAAGAPPIIARRVWARGVSPPRVAPGYGDVRLAFVHHTETPNGYAPGEVPAMLRGIYVFHRFIRGWNDIGYNFVVDLYGRIFEARAGGIDEPVVGAQAGGYNIYSSGVAVLGSFMQAPAPAGVRAALERLLAWKLSLHGLPAVGRVTVRVDPAGAAFSRFPANARVRLPRIAGHRDADSTDCPGDALYHQLPGIRAAVRARAPLPVRATLTLLPGPALAGTLALLDGTPLAGTPVALQARAVTARGQLVSERTLVQVGSDAQGRWTLPVSALAAAAGPLPAAGLALRALYLAPGSARAAVSEPRQLPAAAFRPPPSPAPTPPAPVPPAP